MNKSKQEKIRKAILSIGFTLAEESWAEGGIAVSAEQPRESDYAVAGDYYAPGAIGYDEWGINLEIVKIAEKHKCFCEWVNAGVFGVYEI